MIETEQAEPAGSSYDEVLEPSRYARHSVAGLQTGRGSLSALRLALKLKRQSTTNSELEGSTAQNEDAFRLDQITSWNLNFREAAIFLEEGENNDKLTTHPDDVTKLQFYFFTHSTVFNLLVLFASFAILALALFEPPGYPVFTVSAAISTTLELVILVVFCADLILKLQWFGASHYVRHVRTMMKTIIIILMFLDSILYLTVSGYTIRVTRALRPIFLMDCTFMRGSRRFVRLLFKTVPRVLLMLVLVFFIIFIYAVIGFYMFYSIPNYEFFDTFFDSFLSLFVLLTLSNFPDVMLPAYDKSRWYGLYFASFISLEIYIVLNLLFAVVYDQFSLFERQKLRDLFLHRRVACDYAFRKLVRKSDPHHVTMRNYEGLLSFYKPSMSKLDVLLSYKALTKGESSKLTIDEFYNIYEMTKMKWKLKKFESPWYSRLRSLRLFKVLDSLKRVITSKSFDWTINVILLMDACLIIAQAATFPQESVVTSSAFPITFSVLYGLEMGLRITALGGQFFRSPWNIYDLAMVSLIWITLPMQLYVSWPPYACTCRLLRLFRMMRFYSLYRDLVGAIKVLAPRILNATIVCLCIYYSFAILGMELFADLQIANCCEGSGLEYSFAVLNETGGLYSGYYNLNFQNILSAGMTLFVIMTVNDWFITVKAYCIVAGSGWPQAYFLIFFLCMMIIMVMIVSFIFDALLFRLRYSRLSTEVEQISRAEITLTSFELDACKKVEASNKQTRESARESGAAQQPAQQQRRLQPQLSIPDALHDLSCESSARSASETEELRFIGERNRSPFDFSLEIYSVQARKWSEEHKQNRMRHQSAARTNAEGQGQGQEQQSLQGEDSVASLFKKLFCFCLARSSSQFEHRQLEDNHQPENVDLNSIEQATVGRSDQSEPQPISITPSKAKRPPIQMCFSYAEDEDDANERENDPVSERQETERDQHDEPAWPCQNAHRRQSATSATATRTSVPSTSAEASRSDSRARSLSQTARNLHPLHGSVNT